MNKHSTATSTFLNKWFLVFVGLELAGGIAMSINIFYWRSYGEAYGALYRSLSIGLFLSYSVIVLCWFILGKSDTVSDEEYKA